MQNSEHSDSTLQNTFILIAGDACSNHCIKEHEHNQPYVSRSLEHTSSLTKTIKETDLAFKKYK